MVLIPLSMGCDISHQSGLRVKMAKSLPTMWRNRSRSDNNNSKMYDDMFHQTNIVGVNNSNWNILTCADRYTRFTSRI